MVQLQVKTPGGVGVPVTTLLLQMQVEDLAYWMGKFLLEVRKVDGGEYPPKLCIRLCAASSATTRRAAFTTSIRLTLWILGLATFDKRSMPRCSVFTLKA